MLTIDTSALLKRYLNEPGRDLVVTEMTRDQEWVASALAFTEAYLAVCKATTGHIRRRLQEALARDEGRFLVVPVDQLCLARAAEIGCEYGARTLDTLHLAAADRLPRPVRFLTFDQPQAGVASALGYQVIGR